jgi:hypothetical protein
LKAPLAGAGVGVCVTSFLISKGKTMKMRILLPQVAMIAALAAVGLTAQQGDEKKLFQEYLEKFGPPGPEHKILDQLVGTWGARCKSWTDPKSPPQTSDGTLVRKSVLGGRFLQENFDGKFMDQPFQGIGTIGFDRAKKKYVTTWIDSMSTAQHVSYGTYSDGLFSFAHEEKCPITGKQVKMRDTLRIVNADEQQMEMFRQMGDEKEFRNTEIVLVRQK